MSILFKKIKYEFDEFRAQKAEFNRKWKKLFPLATPSAPPSGAIPKLPSWCADYKCYQLILIWSVGVGVIVILIAVVLSFLYRKHLLINKALRS